jgi:hypothetical protein
MSARETLKPAASRVSVRLYAYTILLIVSVHDSIDLGLSIWNEKVISDKSNSQADITVTFQILTVASMKIIIFWDVASCRLVQVYGRIRDACCLRNQGYDSLGDGGIKHGATWQKTVVFKF